MNQRKTHTIWIIILGLLFISSSIVPAISNAYTTDKKPQALTTPHPFKEHLTKTIQNLKTPWTPHTIQHSSSQKPDSQPFDGYLLIAPIYSRKTFLIDSEHRIVHRWKSKYAQALGTYLLEDGTLLRTTLTKQHPEWLSGGYHGRIEQLDCNSNLLWEYEHINETQCMHNDIEPLPNGNILFISWELKNHQQAIDAGINPDKIIKNLWVDSIVEITPTTMGEAEIVWKWEFWDHLIQEYDPEKANYGSISDHPELLDINFGVPKDFTVPDLVHLNSLDYHEEWDQILFSSRMAGEIYIIDHSTTTEEAAGHSGGRYGKGGDLLYRWGNPSNYQHGSKDDQQLYAQHDAEWIPKGYPGQGHISIFDNGYDRPGPDYSSTVEIIAPVDEQGNYYKENETSYGPDKPLKRYIPPFATLLRSVQCGSVIPCENGHTFMATGLGGGFILELNEHDEIIWMHLNLYPLPFQILNTIFKIRYYPPDYPGLPWFQEEYKEP